MTPEQAYRAWYLDVEVHDAMGQAWRIIDGDIETLLGENHLVLTVEQISTGEREFTDQLDRFTAPIGIEDVPWPPKRGDL